VAGVRRPPPAREDAFNQTPSMKPLNLEECLKAAHVPEHSAEYWADFPESVRRRLEIPPAPAERRRKAWLPALWGAGAMALGILIGLMIWDRKPPLRDPYDRLKSGEALHEFLPLYLGRLQAIVQDGDHLQLVLSPEKDVAPSLPVWVDINEGRQHRALVTFSGQSFRVGNDLVQVLANPEGQVMLVGNGFLWSNRGATPSTDGVRIEARLLPNNF
jgi:hypothetical protein